MNISIKNFLYTAAGLVIFTWTFTSSSHALNIFSSTQEKSYSHILKLQTYTLNTRNVKIVKAQKNKLWIGTTRGAIRYDISTYDDYVIFDNKNSLLSNGIFAIEIAPNGFPWIGTYGGGISRFDGKKWANINTPHGLADAFVFDIQFAGDSVWLATWSGVNLIRGNPFLRSSWQTFTVENTKKGLIDNWVYAIQIDSQNRLWFGTESGLSLYDGKSWRSWTNENGLGAPYKKVASANQGVTAIFQGVHHNRHYPDHSKSTVNYRPNYIISMKLDKDQNLWIGDWGGGLSMIDTKTMKFKNFTTQEGLPGNYILALEEDKWGNLWIGTNNGLSRFNGKTFTNYSKINGLNSDFIFSLEFTSDNSLWTGGHYGLDRISLNPSTGEPQNRQ